jgi:acetoin utilization deacetylase AcuC-like enzyme
MKYSFNKKVLFYYDDIIGTYQYTPGHPMKPFRLPMTQELVKAYNLDHKMDYIVSTNFNIKKPISAQGFEFQRRIH